MTADVRCELTDLIVEFCAHCQGHKLPPELEEGAHLEPLGTRMVPGSRHTVQMYMRAEHNSRCPGCRENWIDRGDQIGLVDGRWVCLSCAEG